MSNFSFENKNKITHAYLSFIIYRLKCIFTFFFCIKLLVNQRRKQIKRILIRKEVKFRVKVRIRVRLGFFANNMILYIEDQKFTKNTSRNNESYRKVASFKVNTQKSVAFLYTKNKVKINSYNLLELKDIMLSEVSLTKKDYLIYL